MSNQPTTRAAVDEGRDPYGVPGRGNGGELWRRLTELPCTECGATHKSLTIDKDKATIVCGDAHVHKWRSSDFVIDTYPETYTWFCDDCGLATHDTATAAACRIKHFDGPS